MYGKLEVGVIEGVDNESVAATSGRPGEPQEIKLGDRTHLIEDHLFAHIVHFLSMSFSQYHRYSDCEQTHQQGTELNDIRVLQLRSGVNNTARHEFSARGEGAPYRRIRWTCHRRGGRAYAVVRA